MVQSRRTRAAVLSLLLLTAPAARAQDGGRKPAPPAPAPAAKGDDEAPPPARVYIPFEDLKKVFEKEGQGVFVPYAEFQALWRKAMDRPETPAPSGVATAIYEGRVEGDLAVVEGSLEVVSGSDGEAAVPVGLGDAALGEATLDGKPAVILADPEKGRRVVVRGRGPHTLHVTLVAPIQPKDGDRTVAFPSAGAPVSRLTFRVPGEGVKVTVEPNLATTRSDAGSGTTLVQAYVGAAKEVRLTWRPKPVEAAGVEPVLQVRTEILHRVGEQTVETAGHAALEVLRAPRRSFRLRFPATARVLRVQGADIRSWEDSEVEGGLREVRIELHNEVLGGWEVKFDLETPRTEGAAEESLPAVVFEGASRESGWEAVAAASPVSVRPSAVEGFYRVRPEDLAKWMAGGDTVLAYRYAGGRRRLALAVETLAPEVAVAERSLLELGGGAAVLRALLDVDVRRAGLFQFSVAIPAGYDLEGAKAGDAKGELRPVDARVEGEGDERRAVLDLGTRRLGLFPVLLVLRRSLEATETESSVDLPVIRPAGTARLRGVLAVASDEALDVRSGTVRGFVPADPAEIAAARVPAPEPPPGGARPVLFGFRHAGEDRGGTLLVLRRKPLVTAETVTSVSVEEDRLRVRHAVRFLVRYAGVDAFRVSLPRAVSDRARLDGAGVKERSREADPADAERVLHTVRLQAPALGEWLLSVDYDLPEQPLAIGASRKVEVPVPVVRGVEREVGFYAVTRDPALSVEGQEKGLTYADAREVPAWGGAADSFLAYRFLGHPHSLSLAVTKHEPVAVLQAVVNAMALDTLVGGGAVALTEVRMDVQVNGLQYLKVSLPTDAEIESTEVDGAPVSPRKEGGMLLLPCPRGRGRDDRFPVRVVYRQPAPDAAGRSFRVLLAAPRVPDAMLQATAWTLWVPPDSTFFSGGGNLRPAERVSLLGAVLSDLAATFGAPAAPGAPTARGGVLPPQVTIGTAGRAPYSFARTGEEAVLDARFVPRAVVGGIAALAGVAALALALLALRRGASALAWGVALAAASLLLFPVAAPGLRASLAALLVVAALLTVLGAIRALLRDRVMAGLRAAAPPPGEERP
jgi:hypothetical protein